MRKYLLWAFIGIALIFILFVYPYYQRVFAPNVKVAEGQNTEFFIPTGSDYVSVGEKLLEEKLIVDVEAFHWVAKKMNYPRHVYPGRYVIEDGMSTRELLNLLRSGKQTPLKFSFVKERTVEDFAEHVASQLEMRKSVLLQTLNNEKFLSEMGLKKETVMGIFIPNTYELYWNIGPEKFVERMYKEYRAFWDRNDRNERRKKFGLDRMEVMILASILEEETNKNDEKQRVAGVYLNRIRLGMPLQADPTVKFAVGDFAIRRVLNRHLETDSPYNTYMYKGFPPGPICTASIPSIEAVLNGERHDYMYFCARTDGSGYHHFSRTHEEHINYAREYHTMLNQRNIK